MIIITIISIINGNNNLNFLNLIVSTAELEEFSVHISVAPCLFSYFVQSVDWSIVVWSRGMFSPSKLPVKGTTLR